VFAKEFVFATIGMCMALFISIITDLNVPSGDVLYFYQLTHTQGFSMLYLELAVLPSATGFCSDWNNKFVYPICNRLSPNIYCKSKIISTAITAGLVIIFSESIFAMALRLSMPFSSISDMAHQIAEQSPFGSLIEQKKYISYFAIIIILRAFVASVFSLTALWVSTHITNTFVTLTSPVIAYYLLINISKSIQLPYYLDLYTVFSGKLKIVDPFFSFIYVVVFCLLFGLLFGCLSSKQIKRRLYNE
jgi:hypothetical protein